MIPFRIIDLGAPAPTCRACFPVADKAAPLRELGEILGDVAGRLSDAPSGQRNLLLAGAEPFLHPGLPEIVRAARSGGADRLGVRTDARALARLENASGSVSSGVNLFEFTLWGATAATHDRLIGVDGGFDASTAGMRTLAGLVRSSGAAVALRGLVRVCEHNLSEIPELCGLFASMGCATIRCEVTQSALTQAPLPWLEAAALTGMVNGTWVVLAGMDDELLGNHSVHSIDPIDVIA